MWPRTLPLLLPMAVYVAVVVTWRSQGINPITGDEPHYLIVAESLLRDGDLEVLNNYQNNTPLARELPGGVAPADTHTQGGHSIHGVGLPMLLLPAYALGGALGAKIWLALLVGLAPLAIHRVARGVLPDTGWPLIIALAVGLGQPFVTAAGQIYPDLLAGLIMLWLLRGQSARATWADCLLLAFLPWLHLKFLLPAAIICCFVITDSWRRSRQLSATRMLWGGNATCAIILTLSLLGLGAYNWRAFGSILGPYAPGDVSTSPAQVAMIFLGLHIDRMQGVFFQAPLLLLGVFGLAPFIGEDRRRAAAVGLTYLAVMLPQAAHTNLYGGTSFAGRFFWAAAPLWCLPLLYAVRRLRLRPRLLACLLIAAALAQGVFLWKVLTPNAYAYNSAAGGAAASWLESDPYADFFDISALRRARLLPSLRDADSYLRSPANWAAMGLLVCLALAGHYALRGRRRAALAVAGAFIAAAGALWLIPPAIRPLQISGAEMLRDGDAIASPGVALQPGVYAVALDGAPGGAARWECAITWPDGRRETLAAGAMPDSGRLSATCAVPPGAGAARFMLRLRGGAGVKQIFVWPLAARSPP